MAFSIMPLPKQQVLIVFLVFLVQYCDGRIVVDETSGNPKVNISGGELEGRLLETAVGARAYVFQGIPFAEPPVGALRFKKPVPKRPWDGTILCQDYKAACYQNVSISTYSLMSEDCLFMNVFVGLQCSSENPCPVLYYIHGGAHEFESPSMFPAEVMVENFATHGVVLVLVGYRLGVAGFWSTGNSLAIGNWAMEDMVEGGKWVQREVHHFGGDRTKVTVMGHSSSASAVALLTLSKKTDGLFNQAVFMSGASTQDALTLTNDISIYQDLAISLGCASRYDWMRESQYMKIIRCMKTIPIDVLVNKFNEIRGCSDCSFPPTPITRPKNDGPNGIFPYPLDQMLSERRPLTTLLGTTKNEAGNLKPTFINATGSTVEMMCDYLVNSKNYKQDRRISKECKKQYVFNADPDLYNNSVFPYWAEQVTTLSEDVAYFGPCFTDCTTLMSKGSTVYLYSFDYEKRGLEGVAPWHAQDLTYVMGSHPFPFDRRDYQIQSRYLPLFVNFVKYGNPTPDPVDNATWAPLKRPFGFNYLSVDLPVTMKPDYHKSGILFWNYKVPAIENGGTGKFDFGFQSGAFKQNVQINNGNWRNAFWTVFILLVAVLISIVGVSVQFYRKEKRISKRNDEKNSLLASFKNSDGYQSF